MKNLILFLFFGLSLSCCNSKSNDADLSRKNAIIANCNRELAVSIEIWNYLGNENLIGNYYEKVDNKYVQNLTGWDKDNYPYPKKFDIKINVQNNLLAYEQEKPNEKISDYSLNIILKLKVSKSPNALYPLNSEICDRIEVLKDRVIKNEDFITQPADRNHYIEIWKKDIPFEELYKKYEKQGLFINQFVFEINLIDREKKNTCNYEYIFPMAERGEP